MSMWRCLSCDLSGTGSLPECDKAAEKHTKTAKHATEARMAPGEPPEPPPTFSKGKR